MLHLTDQAGCGALPPSSIASLARAFAYHRDSGLNFMVMTAFFDESGTHGKDSPATVFGGFAANEAQWAQFEDSLKALMARFGVKHMHAKDFRQRRGDFSHSQMTLEQYCKFNSMFLQLIDNNLARGFVAVLSSARYKEIYRPRFYKKKKRRPDSEYGLCFRAIIIRALMFMVDNEDQIPFVPILESGHRNVSDAARIYREIKIIWLRRILDFWDRSRSKIRKDVCRLLWRIPLSMRCFVKQQDILLILTQTLFLLGPQIRLSMYSKRRLQESK
jgi:hypothetical protein